MALLTLSLDVYHHRFDDDDDDEGQQGMGDWKFVTGRQRRGRWSPKKSSYDINILRGKVIGHSFENTQSQIDSEFMIRGYIFAYLDDGQGHKQWDVEWRRILPKFDRLLGAPKLEGIFTMIHTFGCK